MHKNLFRCCHHHSLHLQWKKSTFFNTVVTASRRIRHFYNPSCISDSGDNMFSDGLSLNEIFLNIVMHAESICASATEILTSTDIGTRIFWHIPRIYEISQLIHGPSIHGQRRIILPITYANIIISKCSTYPKLHANLQQVAKGLVVGLSITSYLLASSGPCSCHLITTFILIIQVPWFCQYVAYQSGNCLAFLSQNCHHSWFCTLQ